GLIAGNKPFVRVDKRCDDGRHTRGVDELASDEEAPDTGEAVLGIVGASEGVGVVRGAEQALVGVHAGAVDSGKGLRQEGGTQAVALGDGFDYIASGDDGVGDVQGIGGGEVYLVLAGSNLVMAGLDADVHATQLGDDLTANVCGKVGGEIEVAAAVMGERRTGAIGALLQ